MTNELIKIRGARENNLKNIDISIPKKKIVLFTGVSGSGKSSLVFDTIAAEGQRQLNETYSSYIRNQMPHYGKPDVDEIQNLPVSIIINQKRIGGNARSTVGTITDINPLLRLLFSRLGQPFVGYSDIFSFNNPNGMCPECEGLGKVDHIDIDLLFDKNKSLNDGAIRFPTFDIGGWRWSRYVHSGLFDNDKKLKDYSETEWHNLLYGQNIKLVNASKEWHKTAQYEGVVHRLSRTFLKRESKEGRTKYQAELNRIINKTPCPECQGARLNKAVLSCKIHNKNIADCCSMQISDLVEFLSAVDHPAMQPLVSSLLNNLESLANIGLYYLSLDRDTPSLSGGESQRVKMVRHLGSSLSDIAYILDEPSVGLHPADVDNLISLLKALNNKGNSVLVVEHDKDLIACGHVIIDMGPKAGRHGGEIVFKGNFKDLLTSGTLTGQSLSKKCFLKSAFRKPKDFLKIQQARCHNLKNISVHIPSGILTLITGVAGSGKSSLINHAFRQAYPQSIVIDQTQLRGSARSNLTTYTGILDQIRKIFSKEHQVPVSLFSANSSGGCPYCHGLGQIHTDMAFMDSVIIPCEQCGGSGFTAQALQYTLNGKNIYDVLQMTVQEACDYFTNHFMIYDTLSRLCDVGLAYLTLGQPLNTFSGGERQRIKLAAELKNKGNIYIFDEPSSGLHPSDIARLLNLLDRLVDEGSTVIVIEHNLDIISQADWIIDIGPGAGTEGGQVVFQGTPANILDSKFSVTGRYLKKYVS